MDIYSLRNLLNLLTTHTFTAILMGNTLIP